MDVCMDASRLRGFFSRKGRYFGQPLPHDPTLLRSKLEKVAFSHLLDGIESAVRPAWVRAVNKVLEERVVSRVSEAVTERMSKLVTTDTHASNRLLTA